ncbi:hypothetical protein [Haladaptatus sp. DFWS20]|uniref:hypothetical protein n=1 Tax=Haladaptatus sp. DFWS20 TaxID=3403467 RepID=UPI003EB9D04E
MGRERNEKGQYTEQISQKDVLGAFEKAEDEVLSARNIADYLDCTRQAADKKLRELLENGSVKRIELGKRSVAWRRTK